MSNTPQRCQVKFKHHNTTIHHSASDVRILTSSLDTSYHVNFLKILQLDNLGICNLPLAPRNAVLSWFKASETTRLTFKEQVGHLHIMWETLLTYQLRRARHPSPNLYLHSEEGSEC